MPATPLTSPCNTRIAGVLSVVVDAELEEVKKVVERIAPELSAAVVATDAGWGPSEVKLEVAGEKHTGLQALCDSLGIDRMDTMAFGDGGNDISMLKWAGRGVAMANAETEAVKAAADVITLSNVEEGVAVQLEEMLGAKTEAAACADR